MSKDYGLSLEDVVIFDDIDAMQDKLSAAIKEAGDDVIAHLLLSRANELKGNLKVAAEGYRMCTVLDPQLAVAHFHLGVCEYFLMNYESAIKHMEEALALSHSFFMALFWIGRSYTGLLRYDRAIDAYASLLDNYPRWNSIRLRLGELYMECARFDEAQACYEKLVAENPKSAIARYRLGELYARTDVMKAIDAFRQGLKYSPDSDVLKAGLDRYTSTSSL